ncbi:Mucin-5B [Merluccius polli]|uniref:Mucin-5B n=1 Tax=Merluccius polli TaxID=89951 RepID=A0AA47NBN1_MERPO|nr:Mucin-5B [Merluccius polli]
MKCVAKDQCGCYDKELGHFNNEPCSPCKWSQWFDTSFPTLGNPGGDSETYKDIRAAGYSICDQPSQIECRAKKFPNVTINKVGQVVQCDLANGLTCRNQDQAGPLALCFNYQVWLCLLWDKSYCKTNCYNSNNNLSYHYDNNYANTNYYHTYNCNLSYHYNNYTSTTYFNTGSNSCWFYNNLSYYYNNNNYNNYTTHYNTCSDNTYKDYTVDYTYVKSSHSNLSWYNDL